MSADGWNRELCVELPIRERGCLHQSKQLITRETYLPPTQKTRFPLFLVPIWNNSASISNSKELLSPSPRLIFLKIQMIVVKKRIISHTFMCFAYWNELQDFGVLSSQRSHPISHCRIGTILPKVIAIFRLIIIQDIVSESSIKVSALFLLLLSFNNQSEMEWIHQREPWIQFTFPHPRW